MNPRVRRKILSGALIIACFAAVATMYVHREPIYRGKTLNEWFRLLGQDHPYSESDPAFRAIVEIGEPAVQHALKVYLTPVTWMDTVPERVGLSRVNRWRDSRQMRRSKAFFVLLSLGPRAQAVTPNLVSFIQTHDVSTCGNHITLLGHIQSHPDIVIPILMQCLDSTDFIVRSLTVRALGLYGTNGLVAAPVVRKMLEEKNLTPRYSAATALLGMGDSVDVALPIIQQALQNADTMIAQGQAYQLGQLGERAKPAVPFMVQAMKNSDVNLRTQIIQMLEKIDLRVAVELKAKGYTSEVKLGSDPRVRPSRR